MQLSNDGQLAFFFNRYMIPRPYNLCALFWKLIVSFVALTIVGTVGSVMVFSSLVMPLLWYLWWGNSTYGIYGLFSGAAIATYIVIVVFGGGYWWDNRPRRLPRSQPRFPIVREALRGIKERYCPLIEWTRESPDE